MATLEGRVRSGKPTDEERFELALLNLKPGHDGRRSVELLRTIPQESSRYDLARLWLAFCHIYRIFGRESLAEAVRICDELLDGSTSIEVRAGAHYLKAIALGDLSLSNDIVPDLSEAVLLAPAWIKTRLSLARAYERLKDDKAAERQLLAAKEAAKQPLPENLDLPNTLFELLVTGRGSDEIEKRVEEKLQRLRTAEKSIDIKGHATDAEAARMAALEMRIREGSATDEERFELALLNIEPGHDGYRAVELLRGIHRSSPRSDIAQLWIAHCCIYEFMDKEALEESVRLCDELLGRSVELEVRAGAHFLKAMALWDLAPTKDVIPDLRKAVRLEPAWISIRRALASVYQRLHNEKAAEKQLLAAREAAKKPVPATLDLPSTLFELRITGRGGHRTQEGIEEQLEGLRRARS